MKKSIVVFMVACLVMGMAFASDHNPIKVGGQVGFHSMYYKMSGKSGDTASVQISAPGVSFNVHGQYCFADDFSARVEAGAAYMGKITQKLNNEPAEKLNENIPMQFHVFAGVTYDYNLNEKFDVVSGLGVNAEIGKIDKDVSDSVNIALGLGARVGAEYKLNEKLSVSLMGKLNWHFVNTCKIFKSVDSVINMSYQIAAGCSYAI